MNDDELAGIHAALEEDGVYVHPTLARLISPADLATVEQQVAASTQPVYVVVHPFQRNDQYGGDAEDLLTQLYAAYPEPGVYVSTTDRLSPDEYAGYRLTLRAWDTAEDFTYSDHALGQVAEQQHPDDLGAQLVLATRLAEQGPRAIDRAEAALREAADDARPDQGSGTGSGTGQPTGSDPAADGGTGAAPYLVGGGVVLLLVVLVTVLRRRTGVDRRALDLPASVVERVRDAHDRSLEERARREVLRLGEEIAGHTIDADDHAEAWQAAVDQHDAAGRVLGREDPPDVLDVVGALVLAEDGRAALAAANEGRAWERRARCYLNPLHGAATTRSVVSSGGRRAEVPLCRRCRKDLEKDRTPDVLDVVRRGRPVHYFDTDAEPWSSTGYGALEPDLVRRLHRGPRR